MTDKAVFQGNYSDLRFVKTRKVAQITVEIAIEQAADFVKVFGAPNPAAECPIVIARLDLNAAKQEPQDKPRTKFSEMKPSAQAAMRCNEPGFIKYLEDRNNIPIGIPDNAASVLRTMLNIKSRADLDKDPEAAKRWRQMDDDYFGWQRCPV